MPNQPRAAKVLAVFLLSMTTGAIVLMALGSNPPSEGPFCLSSYYRLNQLERAITSRALQSAKRYNRIEIYYSGGGAGNLEQLAALDGLGEAGEVNCHFVICNGRGGEDGQILASEKWQKQWSCVPCKTWYGSGKTIRICIIADARNTPLTEQQTKQTQALVEKLCGKFDIPVSSVLYPVDWR